MVSMHITRMRQAIVLTTIALALVALLGVLVGTLGILVGSITVTLPLFFIWSSYDVFRADEPLAAR